uniref:Uncharacterized protein n=1 Tax=Sus scrofa TaxID=9823 RepID=A0A4X1U7F7_PIG
MAGGREPHGADLEPLTRASVPHDSDQLRLQPERSLMGEQQPVSSRSASKRQVPCLLHAVKKTWSGHLLCWAHPALCLASRLGGGWHTYKLEHVPVKDVVVGEALAVEQVPEELPQVRVVRLVIKAQGTAEVQVRGELGCKTRETQGNQLSNLTPSCCSRTPDPWTPVAWGSSRLGGSQPFLG